ncbi:right-handed parallel beta-helix repeat-containing protein [Sulfidibacter corallicola]|uniref:Right-handed parallel beta-helix repeat-containing protein n=1 Tax=Sulfidibacter corallicola TaxID=2818388 RepID=A0A8A4TU15_SULCO|nr:right-handed parallel beta-helix repeat-containing protein [Sulfidibacter corallicola]QTD50025.1 right-handed parallel beta-helix repeat-containing protein [Sulfidibacter corallicola]
MLWAETFYVDGDLTSSDCDTYSPASRNCGSGTARAFSTLAGAVAVARAGDEVLVRAGTYQEQMVPRESGTANQPITYRAYPGELVSLTGSFSPATMHLDNVQYLVIEGFRVRDARWLEAVNVRHIVIRNNEFLRTPASGTTGNVRFISSDYNQIVGNVLEEGNDNLTLIDSDYNLISDNSFREGGHSVLSLRCSNFNLFRNNVFSNTRQKIAEVYDCGDDTSAVPNAFDATRHNVFEHNLFVESSSYYSTSGGNGIQYAGQEGIIRHNAFYRNNVGLGMQVYSDEALYNHHNRVYHNVFYDNDCAGISPRGNGVDNVFKNNVIYANRGMGGDCFGEGAAQIVYRNGLQEFLFEANNIRGQQPGEDVIKNEFDSGGSLADFESSHPEVFFGNIEAPPEFRDETAYDFRLRESSPMVDAGVFLTRTANAGSGTQMSVEDALYFRDGFGIEGASGDKIQLEGDTLIAEILAIDYSQHLITLSRPLEWVQGQGVSLSYGGQAPDIGLDEKIAAPNWAMWGLSDHQLCGNARPNVLDYLAFLDRPGCP